MHVDRADRETRVQDGCDGWREGEVEDVNESRRKTESGESGVEVWVGEAVVGFLLVEEEQYAIGGVVVGMTEDRPNMLSDVRGLTATDETCLRGVDEARKNLSEAVSEKFGENFGVTVRKLNGAPVREERGRAIRLRNESKEGTFPRSGRGGAREDRVVQRKKGGSEVFVKGLIPFVRKAIRTRRFTRGHGANCRTEFVVRDRALKKREISGGERWERERGEKSSTSHRVKRRSGKQVSEVIDNVTMTKSIR